ncbi:hypothetical protein BH11BAC3_BH11BAC3_11430 [soil metagenome]
MDINLFNQLYAEGIISGEANAKVKYSGEHKLFSVHWELKTLLYLGVLLLSGGLGILVYKNIDTIGHQAILLFIALVSAGCFYYCYKNRHPFSTAKVDTPNAFFDYVLLLACCTFISFVAYLQFQYQLFGNRYGAATFIPMLVLFFTAYYFDHIGILSMAIVNLAAWLGLTITPLNILQSNDFNSNRIIFTGLFLGVLLIVAGWGTIQKNVKKHFEFTYTNFGVHILFISCLAALFHFDHIYMIWFLLLLGIGYFFYRKATKEKSFYYILIITLYTYIGLSYVVLNLLDKIGGYGMGQIYLGLLYFIASSIVLVLLLIKANKKLKSV